MNGSGTRSGDSLLTRREVMVGAAGLTFSIIGCQRQTVVRQPVDADAAGAAATRFSPWVSINGEGTVTIALESVRGIVRPSSRWPSCHLN